MSNKSDHMVHYISLVMKIKKEKAIMQEISSRKKEKEKLHIIEKEEAV